MGYIQGQASEIALTPDQSMARFLGCNVYGEMPQRRGGQHEHS